MLKVGQNIKIAPVTFGEPTGKGVGIADGVKMRGTVVYIHPLRRFFTVDFGNGCRESFPLLEE